MRNHCAGPKLIHTHASIAGTHVSQPQSECQWNPGLILKQVNFRCKCVRDRTGWSERQRTKIKVMCVYINSQQLPLRKKKYYLLLAVKGMPDNESATEKCTLGRKSFVFEVILKRRWKTFFLRFCDKLENFVTSKLPWVASGPRRQTGTLCTFLLFDPLVQPHFLISPSTWHIRLVISELFPGIV